MATGKGPKPEEEGLGAGTEGKARPKGPCWCPRGVLPGEAILLPSQRGTHKTPLQAAFQLVAQVTGLFHESAVLRRLPFYHQAVALLGDGLDVLDGRRLQPDWNEQFGLSESFVLCLKYFNANLQSYPEGR